MTYFYTITIMWDTGRQHWHSLTGLYGRSPGQARQDIFNDIFNGTVKAAGAPARGVALINFSLEPNEMPR